jgi:hypothetical protein
MDRGVGDIEMMKEQRLGKYTEQRLGTKRGTQAVACIMD